MNSDSSKMALTLAQAILSNIELQELPLSAVLLRCRRLARLVNDQSAYEWFGFELNGYPVEEDGLIAAPGFQVGLAHGRAAGRNARGPLMDQRTVATLEANVAANELRLQQEREPDIHHVPANQFDTLPRVGGQLIRQQLVIDITAAKNRLAAIQSHAHKWVEGVAYELEFAQATLSIWDKRRKRVDAKLAEIAPEALRRLKPLYDRTLEDDPEAWSQAAQTIRNVLKAVADSVHPPDVTGKAEGPLGDLIETTDEKYKNRLIVFVREKQKEAKRSPFELDSGIRENRGQVERRWSCHDARGQLKRS